MKKKRTNTLPYCIKSFRISNFKGIKFIEIKNLPDRANWIFLTGENGFGKTSILQALASSLAGFDPQLLQHTNDSYPDLECKIHSGETFQLNPGSIEQYFGKSEMSQTNFQFLSCYGSARLDTYSESSKRDRQNSNISNLFDSRSLLENIEYKLSRWYSKREDTEFAIRYNETKNLLIDLLGLSDIQVDFKTDQVSYVEKDEFGNPFDPVDISQLASGYRSIVSMIGDMILRLNETQKEVYNPRDLSGIVIIDELDLHFHPKWQKRLPVIFTKCFPRIQFIASTHSPIPLLGAPEHSVFMTVKRTQEDGITLERLNHLENELAHLTPNLLLDSPIFGYAELFSSRLENKESIRTETSQDEMDLNEKIQQRLEKNLSKEQRSQLSNYLKKRK